MRRHDNHSDVHVMCKHVYERDRPLAEIWNFDNDGEQEWSFVCSGDDHEKANLVTICVNCAFESYTTMLQVSDVPSNHVAIRDADDKIWKIRPMSEVELAEED